MNIRRAFVERSFNTWDGAELAYRAWLPMDREQDSVEARGNAAGTPAGDPLPGERAGRKGLVLFHRGHEHGGRWQHVVDALQLDDVAIFAWDARGHGRSSGERGTAESVWALVKDADAFVSHIRSEYTIRMEDIILLGHSVGGVIAAAWVHDFAPPIRGLVLATPAFRVKLYVPGAIPLLRLREALFGSGFVKSYVKAPLLTHDVAEADRYQSDALIFRQIAVNMLLNLHDTSQRLVADAGAIHTPTLMLSAGRDSVVRLATQQQFFQALSSRVKEMHVYPGFFHAIFHERDRAQPIATTRDFIKARFAEAAPAASLLEADTDGHTKREHDRLRGRGGWAYRPVQWGMRTIGRLSEGMRLGWRTGFDSGLTLDYVYEDRPRGITPLGRLIDRAYLSSVGWRGIRQRRINLERTLHDAVARVHARSRGAHVLDIAADSRGGLLASHQRLHPPRAARVVQSHRPVHRPDLSASRRGRRRRTAPRGGGLLHDP